MSGAEGETSFLITPNPSLPRLENYFGIGLKTLPGVIDMTVEANKTALQSDHRFKGHLRQVFKAFGLPFVAPEILFESTAGFYSVFYDRVFINIGLAHTDRTDAENHETVHAIHLRKDHIAGRYFRTVEQQAVQGKDLSPIQLDTYNIISRFGEGIAYWVEKDLACLQKGIYDDRDRSRSRRELILKDEGAEAVIDSVELVDRVVEGQVAMGSGYPQAVLKIMENPLLSGIGVPDFDLAKQYLMAA